MTSDRVRLAAQLLGISREDFVGTYGPDASSTAEFVLCEERLARARRALAEGPGASARYLLSELDD